MYRILTSFRVFHHDQFIFMFSVFSIRIFQICLSFLSDEALILVNDWKIILPDRGIELPPNSHGVMQSEGTIFFFPIAISPRYFDIRLFLFVC